MVTGRLGFLIGAAPAVLYGIKELAYWYTLAEHLAPMKLPCGNPIGEALLMIVVVGPVCGMVGMSVARTASRQP